MSPGRATRAACSGVVMPSEGLFCFARHRGEARAAGGVIAACVIAEAASWRLQNVPTTCPSTVARYPAPFGRVSMPPLGDAGLRVVGVAVTSSSPRGATRRGCDPEALLFGGMSTRRVEVMKAAESPRGLKSAAGNPRPPTATQKNLATLALHAPPRARSSRWRPLPYSSSRYVCVFPRTRRVRASRASCDLIPPPTPLLFPVHSFAPPRHHAICHTPASPACHATSHAASSDPAFPPLPRRRFPTAR